VGRLSQTRHRLSSPHRLYQGSIDLIIRRLANAVLDKEALRSAENDNTSETAIEVMQKP